MMLIVAIVMTMMTISFIFFDSLLTFK